MSKMNDIAVYKSIFYDLILSSMVTFVLKSIWMASLNLNRYVYVHPQMLLAFTTSYFCALLCSFCNKEDVQLMGKVHNIVSVETKCQNVMNYSNILRSHDVLNACVLLHIVRGFVKTLIVELYNIVFVLPVSYT